MTQARRIKPISYLKANAAQIVRDLAEEREPIIITQNGEAKAAILDIESFEETQETMALLKILALGNRQIEMKRTASLSQVVNHLLLSGGQLDEESPSVARETQGPYPARKPRETKRAKGRRQSAKR